MCNFNQESPKHPEDTSGFPNCTRGHQTPLACSTSQKNLRAGGLRLPPCSAQYPDGDARPEGWDDSTRSLVHEKGYEVAFGQTSLDNDPRAHTFHSKKKTRG